MQAPPNLTATTSRGCSTRASTTGAASRRSRSTTSTPRRRGRSSSALRAATESRGLELAPRLTVYPELRSAAEWLDPAVLPARAARLRLARARARGRLVAGRGGRACRSSSRATPLPLDTAGRARRGRDRRACSARAATERQRVFAAADALRREVNGDDVTYVVTRNIQYTNVCYFRCGFCAFSKGKLAANLRGAPYLVPHEEIVRRCGRGVGARRDRGLPAGRHPPGLRRRLLPSVVRAIKDAVPEIHVHAFRALEVWQGAATLGVPLDDYLARLRDDGPRARCRAPRPRSSTTRCGASSAPTRSRPRSGSRCTTPRTGSGLRSNNTIMFGHVDGPRRLGAPPARVRELQRRTGGFTEFVPLPFVHMEAPIYLQGPRAAAGRRSARCCSMHAVGRLALHPWIDERAGLVGEGRARRAWSRRCAPASTTSAAR